MSVNSAKKYEEVITSIVVISEDRPVGLIMSIHLDRILSQRHGVALLFEKDSPPRAAKIQAEKDLIGSAGCRDTGGEGDVTPKVLLVEDNLQDSVMIAEYLKGMRLNFKTVQTGEAALDAIGREKIDLVLLDMMLPGLNGIDICRKIKGSEETAPIQVVIVTSFDDLKMKIKGIESGADDFLLKPLNADEIRARVTALLNKKVFMDRLNERANSTLQAAITDGLTGVHNYAYFRHIIDLEIRRSRRHENKMALLMIDLDDFKRFNDRFGHPAGDRLLKDIGGALKDNVRDVDVVARYGGDEFAVVLPYAGWKAGRQVAERLLEKVNKLRVEAGDRGKEPAGIPVSIGLAVFPDNGDSTESIISAADTALYAAKNKGKCRVCSAGFTVQALLQNG